MSQDNKTQTVSLPSGNYLFVKVEPQWHDYEVYNESDDGLAPMVDFWKMDGAASSGEIDLPVGRNYSIIGKASELTDEQWGKIIEIVKENVRVEWDVIEGYEYGNIYKDYQGDGNPYYSTKGSGFSLVKSKGMEIEECLILKID